MNTLLGQIRAYQTAPPTCAAAPLAAQPALDEKNDWFENEVTPELKAVVAQIIGF